MPFVRANPTQYLLVGRGGTLENRGAAVQAYLLPGTIHVLVPSTKQEATFEFTQETRDGIPLRFKGIVIYRITNPVAAAQLFDFTGGDGIAQVNALLTHVVLGELRHAVSHMTMVECIEQRKTTLSSVVQQALDATIHSDAAASDWGITVEVSQLAQVFIVDAELRAQLEAEVRNEVRLKSEQSDIRTAEEAKLAAMTSAERVAEQKLAGDRDDLRRNEELEVARLARERRLETEQLASRRHALELAQELAAAEMATEEAKLNVETPIRLLRVARDEEVARAEAAMRVAQNAAHALEVEHDLARSRAEQAMRLELLPVLQLPEVVESASHVLQGANLSLYGESGQVIGAIGPVLDLLMHAVRAAGTSTGATSVASETA